MHCSAIVVLAAGDNGYPFLGTLCSSVLSPSHLPAVPGMVVVGLQTLLALRCSSSNRAGVKSQWDFNAASYGNTKDWAIFLF